MSKLKEKDTVVERITDNTEAMQSQNDVLILHNTTGDKDDDIAHNNFMRDIEDTLRYKNLINEDEIINYAYSKQIYFTKNPQEIKEFLNEFKDDKVLKEHLERLNTYKLNENNELIDYYSVGKYSICNLCLTRHTPIAEYVYDCGYLKKEDDIKSLYLLYIDDAHYYIVEKYPIKEFVVEVSIPVRAKFFVKCTDVKNVKDKLNNNLNEFFITSNSHDVEFGDIDWDIIVDKKEDESKIDNFMKDLKVEEYR